MQDCWSFTCCLSWNFAHRQNVASLSLFYRYLFGKCSSELAQLVPLSYCQGRYTCYSDRLHDFSVTIPTCYMEFCAYRMLSFDLRSSGFKFRINRHLLTVGSFEADFLYSLTLVYFFVFCNSMPRSGYSALHGILIKKIKKTKERENSWRLNWISIWPSRACNIFKQQKFYKRHIKT